VTAAGLGQLRAAQRTFNRLDPGGQVTSASPLERGADLGGGQIRRSCQGAAHQQTTTYTNSGVVKASNARGLHQVIQTCRVPRA
jgi:hypothetical protein